VAKSRKGKGDRDARFTVGVMLSEFSKRVANDETLPTPSEMLVDLMNGDVLSGDSKLRVERIIQLLRGQKEYISLISAHVREHGTPLIAEAYMMTLIDISDQLNEKLSRYAVIPQTQSFFPVPFHYFLPAASNDRSPEERAEVSAVLTAVQLAQRDQLQDVRQCSCGDYFVAGRIDQSYCSVKCRVKAHQSSEEFKAKRRKADRKRYRLHREGKVKEATRRNHGPEKTR
jgi:hypothetical protein